MIDMEITNRFKIGDKVKLISTLTEQNTGIGQNVLDELLQQEYLTITNSSPEDTYELNDYWWFSADQLKTIYINNSHETLNQLIDMITNSEIDKIVVLYKDRLIRFGYELIENLCVKYRTTIEIIDNTERTEEQELVEDLIQIVTVFSCRLQGKRANKAKKMIKELIEDDTCEKS